MSTVPPRFAIIHVRERRKIEKTKGKPASRTLRQAIGPCAVNEVWNERARDIDHSRVKSEWRTDE